MSQVGILKLMSRPSRYDSEKYAHANIGAADGAAATAADYGDNLCI
jgi:hypothetical protein